MTDCPTGADRGFPGIRAMVVAELDHERMVDAVVLIATAPQGVNT